MYLSNFITLCPPFRMHQQAGLNWLARYHAEAASALDPALCKKTFLEEITKRIERVACKQENISQRFFLLNEALSQEYEHMSHHSECAGEVERSDFGEKGRFYANVVEAFFEKFYPQDARAPDDLIHVTCTGYNAPSGAQKLVASRKWPTTVTHAYHMGCAGALPAIRIAKGFSLSGKEQIDIVHTELCSLHFNPELHTAEQIVAQSLFADGFAKYTLSREKKGKSVLRLVALHEEFIPKSEEMMKWECENWGLKMTLSKEIPILIGNTVAPFLATLEEKCKMDLKEAIYAIHPGGPKIIDLIQKKLSLQDWQVEMSKKILYERGNMSSATLPHIWEEILKDPKYPPGRVVVGLAFAPGLCVSGIIMVKEQGDESDI